MKKISLKTITEGLSRDEMRSVKAGGCLDQSCSGSYCNDSTQMCYDHGSGCRCKDTGVGPRCTL